jgi:hypothetical protein
LVVTSPKPPVQPGARKRRRGNAGHRAPADATRPRGRGEGAMGLVGKCRLHDVAAVSGTHTAAKVPCERFDFSSHPGVLHRGAVARRHYRRLQRSEKGRRRLSFVPVDREVRRRPGKLASLREAGIDRRLRRRGNGVTGEQHAITRSKERHMSRRVPRRMEPSPRRHSGHPPRRRQRANAIAEIDAAAPVPTARRAAGRRLRLWDRTAENPHVPVRKGNSATWA